MRKITQADSLSDQAYKIIKEEILSGNLRDNDILPEERLASSLGISRTPLRNALLRLSSEGLIIQRKGEPARVASFTQENSLEYMEIRLLLEVFNIEKIITKINEQFLSELQDNLLEQKLAISQGTYNDFIEKDRDFHLLLASLSGNKELERMIHRINTGVNRAFIILSKTVPQSAQSAYEEHLEIYRALEKQNIVLAKNRMTTHLGNVENRFLQGMQQ